jgi:hypothetical protein
MLVLRDSSAIIYIRMSALSVSMRAKGNNDVDYTSGLARHKVMPGIQNTYGFGCTPAIAGHHRMELGIGQELEHLVDIQLVEVELEGERLVDNLEEAEYYHLGSGRPKDWRQRRQREHAHPQPFFGCPLPSYGPSTPFEFL